jgi:hypothetical protein
MRCIRNPRTFQRLATAVLLGAVMTLVISLQSVDAMTRYHVDRASVCPASAAITGQSLLIVLLDRSGSLTYEPGATDPDGYSTSITKALADLWPGTMAVIPFSHDLTPVLGPAALADQGQRDQLKSAIQSYPIGGDTPLDPALHKAFDMLKSAPPGSRVVIVTDGSPDPASINGVDQASDIRANLLPRFCMKGIPISTFGLALDLTHADGQSADRLLRDIALDTGGTYVYVRDSRDLAQVVTRLYADWQHLIFRDILPVNSSYTASIDTYARKVIFVIFRSKDQFKITLRGPDGQPVLDQVLQRSTDRHYEIDSLRLSAVNQAGPYTITVRGDNGAQVYALVESRLHAQLIQPTAQTIAYIGAPLQITAQLYNDATPIIPQPDEAVVNAHVAVLVNSQVVFSRDVELVQENNGSHFSRQITLPGPAGQVQIQIQASYRQVPVETAEAQVTIPLKQAKATIKHTVPPACNLSCIRNHYLPEIIVTPIAVTFLLLLLLLLLPGPWSGRLKQGGQEEELRSIALARSPLHRILFRSRLSARELERYGGFSFDGAHFTLHHAGGGLSIGDGSATPPVLVREDARSQPIPVGKEEIPLLGGSLILAGKSTPVLYLEEEEGVRGNEP